MFTKYYRELHILTNRWKILFNSGGKWDGLKFDKYCTVLDFPLKNLYCEIGHSYLQFLSGIHLKVKPPSTI